MSPNLNWTRLLLHGFLCAAGITGCLALSWMLYSLPEPFSQAQVANPTQLPRVFEVNTLIGFPGEEVTPMASPPPLAQALTREFSEVVAATRVIPEINCIGRYDDKVFVESRAYQADASFFKVFEPESVQGVPGKALKEPYSVVLTESTAKRYFDSGRVLGRRLILNNEAYTVTAVVADPGQNTPVDYDLLLSMATHSGMQENDNWTWNVVKTYLRLNEQASAHDLQERLSLVIDKYARPALGQSFDRWQGKGGQWTFLLQAV